MTAEMFSADDVALDDFTPQDMLSMRALAPSNVFNDTAKRVYDRRVTDPRLAELSEALFSPRDIDFIGKLPLKYRECQPKLEKLIGLAYGWTIRAPDPGL